MEGIQIQKNNNQHIPESFEMINTYINGRHPDSIRESQVNDLQNSFQQLGQKRAREVGNDELINFQNLVRFTCQCGKEIQELKSLSEHIDSCAEMKQKYSHMFQEWKKIIDLAIEDENIEEWRNIRAFYEHFKTKFMDGIKMNREMKRRKLNNEMQNGSQQNELKAKLQLEEKKQEYKADLDVNNFIPDDAGLQCLVCQKYLKDEEFDQIVFLESCGHICCKSCLKSQIEVNYPETECPVNNCDKKLLEIEIRQILGDEQYEVLQVKMTNEALLNEANLIKCKCGNLIELVEGKAYQFKKDDGKILNKIAAKHMATYRVRCNECEINFCASCKVEPYHIGLTCAQYERDQKSKKCRFCQCNIRGQVNHCSKRGCKLEAKKCCTTFLECNHPCYGYNNEKAHPPCLHESCVSKQEDLTLGENSDSFCVICYVQGLGEKPVIQLGCKHMFHMDCLKDRLNRRWDGLAISLKYAHCPSCNQWIDAPGHEWLEKQVEKAKEIESKISEKCVQRAKHEGLDLDERLKDPKSEYFENLELFAVNHLNYYECYECKDPYFGGHKQCGAGAANQQRDANNGNEEEKEPLRPEEEEMKQQLEHKPEQLICPKCASNVLKGAEYGNTNCEKHKDAYIDYKCRFCCSVALFFCFGTHHFCDPCHRKAWEMRNKTEKDLDQCKGKDECPLKIDHPANGKEFALGCGLCRELKLNQKPDEEGKILDF